MNSNIVWHDHTIDREDRERLNGHAGCVIWFTGLSGCGKSTIANALDQSLHQRRVHTMLLDGDNVRHGVSAPPGILQARFGDDFAKRFGLGFSAEDRVENIRRISAAAGLFRSAGIVTLVALVSPYRRDRQLAREFIESTGRPHDFVEVFVDTPLEVCEQRDPKGLYRKARAGEIKNFTGIDDPYEAPQNAELILPGAEGTPQDLARRVVEHLLSKSLIPERDDSV